MSLRLRELGIASLVALFCASATGQTPKKAPAPAASAKHRVKKQTVKAPEPAPTPVVQQQPPAPPPPSRPYEMSPVPPQVTLNGGQLTIVAPNSSLADILNAVKARIGARVEFPSSASQERVAVQLGPGNPRDVLTQLLSGSPFDYILLGSDHDPTAVTQMIVTRRQGGPGPTAVAGSQNPAPRQPEPADEDNDNEPAQPAQAQNPTPTAPTGIGQPVPGQPVNMAQPQPGTPQPLGTPGTMQNAPDQNAAQQPAEPASGAQPAQQNGPRTPEQLLQELQRMQKQEQQKPKPPQ